MYKKILQLTDLTPSQAEIMDHLFQHKDAKASDIAKKIKRSRAIVYKEVEELEIMGLLKKKQTANQVTTFSAGHPSLLKKLIKNKEDQLRRDKQLLDSCLPKMISSYNLINNQPGIRFYEGVRGLKEIYDEILDDGKDFYLIRTAYEPTYLDQVAPIVEEFIRQRLRKKIKVTAIIPSDVDDPAKDAGWLLKRFRIDESLYTAPVEIDIFGDKVAILSFGQELVGLIIESKQVALGLKQLFMLASLAAK
jgi:predicted transcriptional regulator